MSVHIIDRIACVCLYPFSDCVLLWIHNEPSKIFIDLWLHAVTMTMYFNEGYDSFIVVCVPLRRCKFKNKPESRVQKLVLKRPLDKYWDFDFVQTNRSIKSKFWTYEIFVSHQIDAGIFFFSISKSACKPVERYIYSVKVLNFVLDSTLWWNRERETGDSNDDDMILINIHWFRCTEIFRVNVDISQEGLFFFYTTLDAHA